jgi:hypothetical protein
LHRVLCTRDRSLAFSGEFVYERPYAIPVRPLSFYRRDDAIYKHLEFARWAEFACQPFELGLNTRRLRVAQKTTWLRARWRR